MNKILKNEDNILNPFKLTFRNLKLELSAKQQKFVFSFVMGINNALAVWGVGTGKTILASVTAIIFLAIYPEKNVIFITPASLQTNIFMTLHDMGADMRDNRLKFYSYEKYSRSGIECNDCLVIIDEAHNLRAPVGETQVDEEGRERKTRGNIRAKAILVKTVKSNKILLLTATPFVNTPYDIETLMTILNKRVKSHFKGEFFEMIQDKNKLIDYFACKLSINFRKENDKLFPEKRESFLISVMTPTMLEIYELTNAFKITKEQLFQQLGFMVKEGKITNLLKEKILDAIKDDPKKKKEEEEKGGNLSSFYNGVRRIVNLLDGLKGVNPKMEKVLNTIDRQMKEPRFKQYRGGFIIYYNFIDSGLEQMVRQLKKKGLNYARVTGSDSIKQKEKATQDYNQGKINILLISKAGGEGLDLQNTYSIFIMDMPWNEASMIQIIGRGIRRKSHFNLPEKYRYVNVYRVFLIKPENERFVKALEPMLKSEDSQSDVNLILSMMAKNSKKKKKAKIEEIKFRGEAEKAELKQKLKELKDDLRNKEITKADHDEQVKKLKNASWDNVAFNRYGSLNAFLEHFGIKSPSTFSPSIDVYLFLTQKIKQLTINKFLLTLNKIPQIGSPDCSSKNDKKFLEEIAKRKKITPKQRLEILSKIVKSNIGKANNVITVYEKTRNAITKALQQYYTAPPEINKMLNMSNIMKEKSDNINILEPTAGQGAIVKHINNNFVGKFKINWRVGEFDKKNRKMLSDYFTTLGYNEEVLYKERNFLEVPSEQIFDYIFMNPPFHLRESNISYLKGKGDRYDIDFLLKAYEEFLKKGGELVAIIDARRIEFSKRGRIIGFKKSRSRGRNSDRLNMVVNKLNAIENKDIRTESIKWLGSGEKEQIINRLHIAYVYLRKPKLEEEKKEEFEEEKKEEFEEEKKEEFEEDIDEQQKISKRLEKMDKDRIESGLEPLIL